MEHVTDARCRAADGSDTPTRPHRPAPDVERAFRAQATRALIQAAQRQVARLVPMLRRAGHPTSPLTSLELVNQALTDILAGEVPWNPADEPLLDRVCKVVQTRVHEAARRGARFPHLSLEAAANDDVLTAEVTRAGTAAPDVVELAPHLLAAHVVPALRGQVHRDKDARAILLCWAHGVTDWRGVRFATRMSMAKHNAARKRLFYLARRLAPELLEIVRDELRRAA